MMGGLLFFGGFGFGWGGGGFFFLDGGLGGGEAGGGDAVGGTGDVGEAEAMTEFDAGGVASVFAADAEFDVGTCGAAFFGGDAHELAHAVLVE